MRAGELSIAPFSPEQLKPASYVLTLDLKVPVTLNKGDFVVLKTAEHFKLSPKLAFFVSTRGSAAAKGISAVQSSIFCEPDTDGPIALEISYAGPEPVELTPGMSIAKAIFVRVE